MGNGYKHNKKGQFAPGTKGKPPGAVSAKTKAWEELGDYIVGEGAALYMQSIKKLPEDKYQERFEHILEYFKPKLARQELLGKDGKDLFQGMDEDAAKAILDAYKKSKK
mgnify:CR=1 FL=1